MSVKMKGPSYLCNGSGRGKWPELARRGMFLLLYGCYKGGGRGSSIRDQNKGPKLSFVQGHLFIHYQGP